jgi:hypothetical protein
VTYVTHARPVIANIGPGHPCPLKGSGSLMGSVASGMTGSNRHFQRRWLARTLAV